MSVLHGLKVQMAPDRPSESNTGLVSIGSSQFTQCLKILEKVSCKRRFCTLSKSELLSFET